MGLGILPSKRDYAIELKESESGLEVYMRTRKALPKLNLSQGGLMQIFKPYQHDCTNCVWVGWGHDGDKLTNLYFCPKHIHKERKDLGTIVIRYSSEGSDYRSYPVWAGSRPGAIGMEDWHKPIYGDPYKEV